MAFLEFLDAIVRLSYFIVLLELDACTPGENKADISPAVSNQKDANNDKNSNLHISMEEEVSKDISPHAVAEYIIKLSKQHLKKVLVV